jgi:hypothetical protein
MLHDYRSVYMLATLGALASSACATQSAAFRQMSAEDHEQAARAPGSSSASAATPEDHLEVARQLREAEANACTNVPDADRDQGPLAHRDRIAAMELLRDRIHTKAMLRPSGVAIYLRPAPGLTAEWLSHVLECHLAYHGVVGDRIADATSPLFVDNARVALSSTGDGFRITITSLNEQIARQVIDRAQSLVE